jgi:hypothetical protein
MNTNQNDTTSAKNSLHLPEPDPANITALSHNLPNTPIIPDFVKESVNSVLRLFTRKHTQSHDQPSAEQRVNQAD